jgi:conjugal transfer/type IV secretion protein DotA/TraY
MSQDRAWSAQTFDYVIKPGIVPRLRELFGASFTTLAYFVATIFATVRLLPLNHTYLQPSRIGRYGVRDVVAAAAYNLKLRRENIDQIIVFFVILGGMVMLASYAVALVLYVVTSPAFAQSILPGMTSNPFDMLFATPNPEEDLVFRMMDHTFGVEGIFGSQVIQNGEAPNGFHHGMHALLGVYNSALLLFAIFIFLYHIVAVVYETTQSGTPFGQRFDKLWAPLRLVFALGILIPLASGPVASGLNAGQYMLLYIAKYGSGLATNSWIAFNNAIENYGATNPLGSTVDSGSNNLSMIAEPSMPDITGFVRHMMLVRTCKVAYARRGNPAAVRAWPMNDDKVTDHSLIAMGSNAREIYHKLVKFSDGSNIKIRFGEKNKQLYGEKHPGGVFPHCGEIIIPVSSRKTEMGGEPDPAAAITASYLRVLINHMLTAPKFNRFGERMTSQYLPDITCVADPEIGDCGQNPKPEFVRQELNSIQSIINNVPTKNGSAGFEMRMLAEKQDLPDKMEDYGWGGAGIWYNRIAEKNGLIFDAAQKKPYILKMPHIMEEVRDANARKHPDSDKAKSFNPDLGGAYEFDDQGEFSKRLAQLLYHTRDYLNAEGVTTTRTDRGENVIFQAADFLFYTNGMFDVFDNRGVHPIAQIAGFGKTMVNSAIAQLYFATGLSFAAGAFPATRDIAQAASGLYISMAGIAAILGMMMFYVIPLMPFLYFFFAIGKWLRSIAEAMVGIPLWALAHISIEGEGFPTQASENGYYLLLEIFLRPFMVVAALIGASIIFAAQAVILNDIFQLVTQNIGGIDYNTLAQNNAQDNPANTNVSYMRPRLDQFFYTVMYVIILYIMANASFKLIDAVPQSILRWAGSSVPSFGDTSQDPLSNFQRNLAIGQMLISGQIGQGIQKAGTMGGSAASSLASRFNPTTSTAVSRLGY